MKNNDWNLNLSHDEISNIIEKREELLYDDNSPYTYKKTKYIPDVHFLVSFIKDEDILVSSFKKIYTFMCDDFRILNSKSRYFLDAYYLPTVIKYSIGLTDSFERNIFEIQDKYFSRILNSELNIEYFIQVLEDYLERRKLIVKNIEKILHQNNKRTKFILYALYIRLEYNLKTFLNTVEFRFGNISLKTKKI